MCLLEISILVLFVVSSLIVFITISSSFMPFINFSFTLLPFSLELHSFAFILSQPFCPSVFFVCSHANLQLWNDNIVLLFCDLILSLNILNGHMLVLHFPAPHHLESV